MTSSPTLRALVAADGPEALAFWKQIPGLGLSPADEPEALARFVARNPGLSFCACDEAGELVATVLAGHDGRRGFLYHVAVAPEYRGQGLSGALVGSSLAGLKAEGIGKVHVFVLADNTSGISFWMGPAAAHGWKVRGDLLVFSRDL